MKELGPNLLDKSAGVCNLVLSRKDEKRQRWMEQDANDPQGCSSAATAAGDGVTDADFHRWNLQ